MIVKKGEGFKEERNTDVWGMETLCIFCHQAFKDEVIMGEGEYRWSEETIVTERKANVVITFLVVSFCHRWSSLFVLAITICSEHHRNWVESHNDDICLTFCLLFLI